MLLAIPIGYFVVILLLISGVYSGVEFLNNCPDNGIGAAQLHGLVTAGWPAIAGSAILLLIQINTQLEKLRLVAHYTPATDTKELKEKKKKAESSDGFAATAPAVQPQVASTHNLAELANPTPTAVVPMYPNSPIPGGGRVPQAVPAAAPTHTPLQPTSIKRAPRKGENNELNYFKVD